MSNHEASARSPMASRRVRRHAMGISNAHTADDTTSATSRATVSLVHADRLVKVPQHLRSPDPAARETRVEDRPLVTRVHDKLFNTLKERHVCKVLRSCSGPESKGLLTPSQLHTALELLHVGLERRDRERIIARVAQDESSKVHYLDFMKVYDIMEPLGDEDVAVSRGTSVPGPPTVRPGGGGSGVRDGGTSYWNWQRHGSARLPGVLSEVREGTADQARSDELLTGLIVAKLGNCPDKLRKVFRRMDGDRNSVVNREELAKGIAMLGITVSRAQVDHLFDLCDTNHDGVIDYSEFVQRFEESGLRGSRSLRRMRGQDNSTAMDSALTTRSTSTYGYPDGGTCGNGGVPLSQSLALSVDEVQGALRHPLVLELARSLYGKGSQAVAPFKQRDLPRCGRLDLHELTDACRALVPGIGERQVAAVMVAVDPGASSHVDYRDFITRVEGGLSHPRLTHSAPPGGKAARGALARFGETLTVPEALPSPHARSLSAVTLVCRAETDAGASGGGDSGGGGGGDGGGGGGGGPTTGKSPRVVPAPPAPVSTHPDRDQLFKIHDIAIGPVIKSLNSTAAAAGDSPVPVARRSVELSGSGGSRVSRAPSHSTGRFSRFWSQRFADTSSITTGHPSSALQPAPGGPFVRKTTDFSRDFLHFQAEDRAKEARRRQQHVQRSTAHLQQDAAYSAQDDSVGVNEGRLEVARAARQKYEERCEMLDRVRQMETGRDHTFFNKPHVFGEHKSDTANMAVWADQNPIYF